MPPRASLQLIMEKGGDGVLRVWACRGVGKGCPRNRHRSRKVHCEDCVAATDPSETLEHLVERVARGEA